MATKRVVLKLTPQQARTVGEAADAKAEELRVVGHTVDAREWENIAAEAHDAADRGFAT